MSNVFRCFFVFAVTWWVSLSAVCSAVSAKSLRPQMVVFIAEIDPHQDGGIYCADDMNRPYFIGQLGDYIDTDECDRVEFRLKGDARRSDSVFVGGLVKLLDAAAEAKSHRMTIHAPSCKTESKLIEVNLMAIAPSSIEKLARVYKLGDHVVLALDVPLAEIRRQQVDAHCRVEFASIRGYRKGEKAIVETVPLGAEVYQDGATHWDSKCSPTACRVMIRFDDADTPARLTLRKKCHVNQTVKVEYSELLRTESRLTFNLRPAPCDKSDQQP